MMLKILLNIYRLSYELGTPQFSNMKIMNNSRVVFVCIRVNVRK